MTATQFVKFTHACLGHVYENIHCIKSYARLKDIDFGTSLYMFVTSFLDWDFKHLFGKIDYCRVGKTTESLLIQLLLETFKFCFMLFTFLGKLSLKGFYCCGKLILFHKF
ncbi:hypothetical protein [Prevotella histicola]|uniref:Uncharacterized protein n=1 Tax=Prevotella histicola F0411 TaxID=857291 RepID=G6AG51_9BACT|nr:hypothetical protein [Prevotella histicola]EHG16381.1 hypothetical protein HMPREF9138_01078 [Prevotella histicola F0411]QUB85091.1 hypothetical protein J5A62_09275 [Prevotella histicola]